MVQKLSSKRMGWPAKRGQSRWYPTHFQTRGNPSLQAESATSEAGLPQWETDPIRSSERRNSCIWSTLGQTCRDEVLFVSVLALAACQLKKSVSPAKFNQAEVLNLLWVSRERLPSWFLWTSLRLLKASFSSNRCLAKKIAEKVSSTEMWTTYQT